MLGNRVECVKFIQTVLLLILAMQCECVEGQRGAPKKRKTPVSSKRRGRTSSEDVDSSTGVWIIFALLALLVVPTILYFIYTVLRDPITPTLVRNAWDVAKQRYFGYLSTAASVTGGSGSGSSRKHHHHHRAHNE